MWNEFNKSIQNFTFSYPAGVRYLLTSISKLAVKNYWHEKRNQKKKE
jgi:hypothetical protein